MENNFPHFLPLATVLRGFTLFRELPQPPPPPPTIEESQSTSPPPV